VHKIKTRFVDDPSTYKAFLEILHAYQKQQRPIKDVVERVSHLFKDHPDLVRDFTYFLPGAAQEQVKERVARPAEPQRKPMGGPGRPGGMHGGPPAYGRGGIEGAGAGSMGGFPRPIMAKDRDRVREGERDLNRCVRVCGLATSAAWSRELGFPSAAVRPGAWLSKLTSLHHNCTHLPSWLQRVLGAAGGGPLAQLARGGD
jgi:hypothetical protein